METLRETHESDASASISSVRSGLVEAGREGDGVRTTTVNIAAQVVGLTGERQRHS